jgi:hypothetical protein
MCMFPDSCAYLDTRICMRVSFSSIVVHIDLDVCAERVDPRSLPLQGVLLYQAQLCPPLLRKQLRLLLRRPLACRRPPSGTGMPPPLLTFVYSTPSLAWYVFLSRGHVGFIPRAPPVLTFSCAGSTAPTPAQPPSFCSSSAT